MFEVYNNRITPFRQIRLTLVKFFPARTEGVRRHPHSERGAYPKPGRMVSGVLDRVVVLDRMVALDNSELSA